MFSVICTRINGWSNNGEAGDLKRKRAHYDVTLMSRVLPTGPLGTNKSENGIKIKHFFQELKLTVNVCQI